MKTYIFRNRQAGDTIVEVLIAVAVISMILAGAFLVTSRSTRAVRDSEEHAQALQYLQGQVELLRAAAGRSGGLPATLTTPFCLDLSQTYYQPAGSSPQCTLGSRYAITITGATATPVVNGTTTFNLVATWPSVLGDTATVYLAYKVVVTP
ncbi:MAG TPA: prepilin-type N-terminal cleavage/methylation domain-containing protein [Candidatus Saccharimonadales bacterium]|nr:prepilin-type N-terminal cleavage/methylation domain-containing protein [Candidatus Saccharimonadales bacterium]